jgi:hypothetical protein
VNGIAGAPIKSVPIKCIGTSRGKQDQQLLAGYYQNEDARHKAGHFNSSDSVIRMAVVSGNNTGCLVVDTERREIAMMLKLPLKSIRIVALVGSLVLVLPVSAIFHTTGGLAINGSIVTHSRVSEPTLGKPVHSRKLPVKNCPVLELRAGLALLSLKPALRFTLNAPIGIGVPNIEQPLSVHSSIEIRNNPPALEPRPSVLEILRI